MTTLVFRSLQFFAHLYCIYSNPSNALQEHVRNLTEVPEQFPFAIAFPLIFIFYYNFKGTINCCTSGQTRYQKILCFTCQPKLLVKKGECICCCKLLCNRYHAWQTITFNRYTKHHYDKKGGNHAQIFKYYVTRIYNTVMSHIRVNLCQERLMIQAD